MENNELNKGTEYRGEGSDSSAVVRCDSDFQWRVCWKISREPPDVEGCTAAAEPDEFLLLGGNEAALN